MLARRSFLSPPLRPLVFWAALTLSLLSVGCAESATGGAGGVVPPECTTDEDCWESDYPGSFACNSVGECSECEHGDPSFGGPVQTPEFWNPGELESGVELGLNPQLAYWTLSLSEYGYQGQPTPSVTVCAPMTVENGEVVSTGTECERLDADDFIHDFSSLVVPIAPSAWLSSGPLNGLYYTQVWFEFGPIYFC